MSISRKAFLDKASIQLQGAGIEHPRDEARALLDAIAGITLVQQLASPDVLLSQNELQNLETALEKRMNRMPISQIAGRAWFFGWPFTVSEDTLTPRPESERLVEVALEFAHERSQTSILDAFAGTGAIGISIAHALVDSGQECALTMTDISSPALEIAKLNAAHYLSDDVWEVECADIWPSRLRQYDIITSNPPYIATDDINALMPEVRRYEPRRALDGGEDGLHFYRRLANEANQRLADHGILIVEIGATQEASVSAIFLETGYWSEIDRRKDFAGHPRVLVFSKKN